MVTVEPASLYSCLLLGVLKAAEGHPQGSSWDSAGWGLQDESPGRGKSTGTQILPCSRSHTPLCKELVCQRSRIGYPETEVCPAWPLFTREEREKVPACWAHTKQDKKLYAGVNTPPKKSTCINFIRDSWSQCNFKHIPRKTQSFFSSLRSGFSSVSSSLFLCSPAGYKG